MPVQLDQRAEREISEWNDYNEKDDHLQFIFGRFLW